MDAVRELGRVEGKHAIGLAGVEAERLERADREDWSNLSAGGALARAYGDDEPEYSVTNVRGR